MQTERAISEANVEIGRHYEIRHGKRGKRREVGMTTGAASTRSPWIALVRRCRSVRRSARSTDRRAGRPRSSAAPPAQLRRLAAETSVRRRFAPHPLRRVTPSSWPTKASPLNVTKRQLGHASLGTTSSYPQGIENAEIIDTVHARRAPMTPARPGY